MRRKLVSVLPHKYELKNEHFWMFGSYGVGSFLVHTIYGMLIISFAYFVVFAFDVHDGRCGK